MKTKRITTFIHDPGVGRRYYKDALALYTEMTPEDMIWLLHTECAELAAETKDVRIWRIFHTLGTIWDKMNEQK